MDGSSALALIAVVVSGFSLANSVYSTQRDRARIKATSEYSPPSVDEEAEEAYGPSLRIRLANHGRRPVKLEFMIVDYGDGKSTVFPETLWHEDEQGFCRIGENDRYEHNFDPDSDGMLTSDDGAPAIAVRFEDSLGRSYKVSGIHRNLTEYLAAARDA